MDKKYKTITDMKENGQFFIKGLDVENPDKELLQEAIDKLAQYECMNIVVQHMSEEQSKKGMSDDVRDIYETVLGLSPSLVTEQNSSLRKTNIVELGEYLINEIKELELKLQNLKSFNNEVADKQRLGNLSGQIQAYKTSYHLIESVCKKGE